MSEVNKFNLLNSTLSLKQTSNLIKAVGKKRTVLVRGPMGSGKSSMLWSLVKELNDDLKHQHAARQATQQVPQEPVPQPYTGIYLDATTKTDSGDLFMVQYGSEEYVGEDGVIKTRQTQTFITVPHEELGLHLNTPIVLNIDELGKAPPSVKLALTRLILERKSGKYTLHPMSIIFATTNLAAEGLGDMFKAHELDRMIVVDTRNPDNIEWIEWAMTAGIDPIVTVWAREHPELFHDFRMYPEWEDEKGGNPYIPHPRRTGGVVKSVTPRGLHAVSDVIKERHYMDDQTLKMAMAGAIGQRGALDLMAFVTIAGKMPTIDQIKTDPENAPIPTSSSMLMMTIHRSLRAVDKTWVRQWMVYLNRLPRDAAAVFVAGVRMPSYNETLRQMVCSTPQYQVWCVENAHMFANASI